MPGRPGIRLPLRHHEQILAACDSRVPGGGGVRGRLRERTGVAAPPHAGRPRAAAVQRCRRRLHVGYDSASRASRHHGRLGAFAWRALRRRGPLRAHCRWTARRDRHDADVAARSRPAGSRRRVDASQDDHERRDPRDADAGHVDRRGDGGAGSRARAGIRSAFPRRHDQTSPGRDRHGRRAVQVVRRGAGRDRVQVRVGRVRGSVHRNQSDERHAGEPPSMSTMRLLLINGLLATALFAAGAFAVPACASSGNKTSLPAAAPGTPPAVAAPASSTPPPSAATAATPSPTLAPAAAAEPTPAPETAAASSAADGGAGRGGRGTPPPPPPPPPPAVMPAPVAPVVSATAPAPDPRVGLKAGRWDAAQAAWNMRMLSTTPPKGRTLGATHSDLAFSGSLVIQGNYNGFDIYDISNPSKPALMQTYLCPASQNDVSVYRNLLFMSSEATNSRADCGFDGVPEPVSKLRVRGIHVFDISDVKRLKIVTTVQTCRGSHTHTVVTKQGDDANVFIYVSGTAAVRSAEEVPGCADGGIDDPNTARFRLEVIKVPLRTPERAAIVSSPRIFQDLPVPPRNEERAAQDERDRQAALAAAIAAGR